MPSALIPLPVLLPPPARSTTIRVLRRCSKIRGTTRCFSKARRFISRCSERVSGGGDFGKTERSMTARHRRLRLTAAALCFAAAAVSAVPVGAGSLLLENIGIGGAAFTMNIESFQEKKYKATLAQQYDFSCGSAALATLLTYNYNIPVSEQDVVNDMVDKAAKQGTPESRV